MGRRLYSGGKVVERLGLRGSEALRLRGAGAERLRG